MSSGSVRRVSRQDIQLVQNLIERCLQLYMNRKEVVDTLLQQAKIEPGFTELVWQKLEEENQEFFKAYYLRLVVKHQINEFNKLLEQQVRLMSEMHSAPIAAIPASNGTHIPELHQNTACYTGEPTGVAVKPEIRHQVGSGIHNVFTNGGSPLHTSMHVAVDMSRIDASSMISAHNSNVTLIPGMNGGMIKSEPDYPENSPYIFSADGAVLEARATVGDACSASFPAVEPNSQPLNEPLLDPDTAQFGYLTHIPRTFSLSDLTADFSQSSGILESYPRSPFLAQGNENFIDSRGREQGEHKTLDSISEGFSYDDFGSE